MDNWVELKNYHIILDANQLEFGLGISKFISAYPSIQSDGIVVFTTDSKGEYQKVFKWLIKKYYWREHNSLFSHNSHENECNWLQVSDGKVRDVRG